VDVGKVRSKVRLRKLGAYMGAFLQKYMFKEVAKIADNFLLTTFAELRKGLLVKFREQQTLLNLVFICRIRHVNPVSSIFATKITGQNSVF
jgi:hypothetical protein